MDSYVKSSLKDEFCYRRCSDSTVDYNLGILPPVYKQGDDCIAHALACAVEARYRKTGIWHSALSMTNLLNNVKHLHVRSESILAVGGIDGGENSDMEVTDDEGTDQEQFGLSWIDNYTLVSKPKASVSKWIEEPEEPEDPEEPEETMKFDNVVKEIRNNGPVLASFFPDWDFSYWSKEYARNCIYEGLYFAELSEADKKKHRGHKNKRLGHVVVLIGFGSGEKEYFIAENSHGLNWGDEGVFRLDPRCVRRVFVPIL